MTFVTLVSRAQQNAPFWGPVMVRLHREHHFVLRPIETTLSTPADLTFPQFGIAMMLISHDTLSQDQHDRVAALLALAKRPSVVLLVQCSRDARAAESVQLCTVMADFHVTTLGVTSITTAASSIAALVQSFAQSQARMAVSMPMTKSEDLLRWLALDEAQLQVLYERCDGLVDLAIMLRDRPHWDAQVGRDVVTAVERFLRSTVPNQTAPAGATAFEST